MKKSILIVCLLVFTKFVSAQTSNYFVEDIQYVKQLVLNFCIDSFGVVNNVTIRKEYTNYENTEVIDDLMTQLDGMVLPLEYKNNCYDEKFMFINHQLRDHKISEEDSKTLKSLKKFRTGEFVYMDPMYSHVVVKRTKDLQFEESNGEISKYEIKWIAPDKFTLTYLEVRNTDFNYLIGQTIDVEIIKVIEDNQYIYKSSLHGQVIFGIMKKSK